MTAQIVASVSSNNLVETASVQSVLLGHEDSRCLQRGHLGALPTSARTVKHLHEHARSFGNAYCAFGHNPNSIVQRPGTTCKAVNPGR